MLIATKQKEANVRLNLQQISARNLNELRDEIERQIIDDNEHEQLRNMLTVWTSNVPALLELYKIVKGGGAKEIAN
jgi:hypothetical protein